MVGVTNAGGFDEGVVFFGIVRSEGLLVLGVLLELGRRGLTLV